MIVKSRGLPNQFRIREKGTDLWLSGYVDGTPFYTREKAAAWLRKEVKSHVLQRDDRCRYSDDLRVAELDYECERYEIIEVTLALVGASPNSTAHFKQEQIDAYKDGFMRYDSSSATPWKPPASPYKSGIEKDWWTEGYMDAYRVHSYRAPLYPELANR